MIPEAPFSEFFISDEHPMYVQRWGSAKDDPKPSHLRLGLFLFMAASTQESVGPLVLMVSLAGSNAWPSADGPSSSSTGRESGGPPGPACSFNRRLSIL
jgi:hypothetical protein